MTIGAPHGTAVSRANRDRHVTGAPELGSIHEAGTLRERDTDKATANAATVDVPTITVPRDVLLAGGAAAREGQT
jgi:hypothetical protein